MLKASIIRLYGPAVGAVCVLSLSLLPLAGAQQNNREEVTVTASDVAAARDAGPAPVHGFASRIAGAKDKLEAIHRQSAKNAAAFGAPRGGATGQAISGPFFYPADLSSGGGPTLSYTREHAIYVNAPGSISATWGNPEGFLRDLSRSNFIHLTDQYVGTSDNNRYPVGERARVRYGTPGTTLYTTDIVTIVHAVALEHGAGLENIYHVFLPPGTDTCFDITTQNPNPVCYSPDNPATFAFCGYHGAVQFSDIGTTLFSVEPYQGPSSGCEIASPAPNGVLIDSTNNVLSHEDFEAITDPIPGLGFWNQTGDLLTGNEIGDECVLFNLNQNVPGSYTPPTFSINGKKYAVQPEYSNTYHGCATVP